MTYDVFISYSRRDYMDANNCPNPQSVVAKLLEELDKAGITYWIDKKGISGSDKFAEIIAQAISDTRMFLFISSEHSNKSEWTVGEIGTAKMMKKEILPFKIDSTPYHFSVILFLANLSHIEYHKAADYPFEELINSLNSKLDGLDPVRKKIRQLKKQCKDLHDIIKQKERERREVIEQLAALGVEIAEEDESDSGLVIAPRPVKDEGEGNVEKESEKIIALKKDARNGDADAMKRLGENYRFGMEGVSKNLAESDSWYRRAFDIYYRRARNGDAKAMCELADMYSNGLYVGVDKEEAFRWYKKSAEHGYHHAFFRMGQKYYYGLGVSKDYAEALVWLRKYEECKHGYTTQRLIGDIYRGGGCGVPKDTNEAVKWYRLAAKQGDKKAIHALKELGYGF